jgi:hypothetical protein
MRVHILFEDQTIILVSNSLKYARETADTLRVYWQAHNLNTLSIPNHLKPPKFWIDSREVKMVKTEVKRTKIIKDENHEQD